MCSRRLAVAYLTFSISPKLTHGPLPRLKRKVLLGQVLSAMKTTKLASPITVPVHPSRTMRACSRERSTLPLG